MQEFKRIFASKTFLFTLLAIVLVNAALFYNEQKENDYGLDLSAANEIVWDMDGGMTMVDIRLLGIGFCCWVGVILV